jgi:hypothetical protein
MSTTAAGGGARIEQQQQQQQPQQQQQVVSSVRILFLSLSLPSLTLSHLSQEEEEGLSVREEDREAMNTIVSLLEDGNLDEVQAYLDELSTDEQKRIGPCLATELRRLSVAEDP